MNVLVSHESSSSQLGDARTALLHAWMNGDDHRFDRYENPFERKWTWRDKHAFPTAVEAVIRNMEDGLLDAAHSLMPPDCELSVDHTRHYTGAFVYEHGDYLNVHVDAGIHPASGWRKAVTALVYLSPGAPLEFWEGDSCVEEEPRLLDAVMTLKPRAGTVVLFANDDWAWHGVPVQLSTDPRALLTVSFLTRFISPALGFANKRERAFFVPRPNEDWSTKMYAIRDRRADPEHYHEAYRSGVSE